MEMTKQELSSTPEYRKHLLSMISIQLLGFLVVYLFIINQLAETNFLIEKKSSLPRPELNSSIRAVSKQLFPFC